MDEDKKDKLEEIGYRILPTCIICRHAKAHFAGGSSMWGTCECFEPAIGVFAAGQCNKFERREGVKAEMGPYEELYTDADLLLRQVFRKLKPHNGESLDETFLATRNSIADLAASARANLTDREREILDTRFGEKANHTLADIEADCESQVDTAELEDAAIDRLRGNASDDWFRVVDRARDRSVQYPRDTLICVNCGHCFEFWDRPIPFECPDCGHKCPHCEDDHG